MAWSTTENTWFIWDAEARPIGDPFSPELDINQTPVTYHYCDGLVDKTIDVTLWLNRVNHTSFFLDGAIWNQWTCPVAPDQDVVINIGQYYREGDGFINPLDPWVDNPSASFTITIQAGNTEATQAGSFVALEFYVEDDNHVASQQTY